MKVLTWNFGFSFVSPQCTFVWTFINKFEGKKFAGHCLLLWAGYMCSHHPGLSVSPKQCFQNFLFNNKPLCYMLVSALYNAIVLPKAECAWCPLSSSIITCWHMSGLSHSHSPLGGHTSLGSTHTHISSPASHNRVPLGTSGGESHSQNHCYNTTRPLNTRNDHIWLTTKYWSIKLLAVAV